MSPSSPPRATTATPTTTDSEALTRAEVDVRRQVQQFHRFLRDRVPSFEKAVIVATSPAIGVRESGSSRPFPRQLGRAAHGAQDAGVLREPVGI